MEGRLSGWKLRTLAEKRGVPVSYKQFEGYQRSGLIPDSEDGGFPPGTLERLIRIRQLEGQARPLWRRAILLQARGYSVDPNVLRMAMLRILPTIKAPKRKMQRVDAVIRWEARKLEDPAFVGYVRPEPLRSSEDPMDPARWKAILARRDIDDRLFGEHASVMCYFALGFKRSSKGTARDISSIPDEEVIVLLTVRKLAGLARAETG